MTSFIGSVMKEHPLVVPAIVTSSVLTLGIVRAWSLYTEASVAMTAEEKEKLIQQMRIKEVFNKLLITEYNLPTKFHKEHASSDANAPKPIFNEKTQKEIKIIKKMIEKSVQGHTPLPNLILEGAAGVGKTMLGADLCNQTGIGYIRIPSGAMENHLKIGSHILAFRDVVKIAESCPAPTYLIMDDGEELVAQRSPVAKSMKADTTKASWLQSEEKLSDVIKQRRDALVNAILEESGKDYRRVGFCITTNRSPIIDAAFVTRARRVTIEAPSMEERKQIIITHLPSVFKGDQHLLRFFDAGRLEKMALQTENFTGRNIVKMLENMYACVQLDEGTISQDTVDAAIVATKKSLAKNQGSAFMASVRQMIRLFSDAVAPAA
ncbi:MAG TPA: AAA family ATPase [Chlamydiales bacterium]|nr:AAA family ATPase [Chlamydiales bacterium]